MALRINLYHEILRNKKQEQYDPLKLSVLFLIIIGIGLASWYIVELQQKSGAVAAYSQKKSTSDKLAPQEAKAKLDEEQYTKQLDLTEKLTKRIEERFYWAPVLEDLAVVVPANVQITKLATDISGDGLRKIQITMEGIAAGDEPRATAEDFRTALTDRMSKKYKNTTASFKTLDEGADPVLVDGKSLRTAMFNISLVFNTGSEPPPPPPPRPTRRRTAE